MSVLHVEETETGKVKDMQTGKNIRANTHTHTHTYRETDNTDRQTDKNIHRDTLEEILSN